MPSRTDNCVCGREVFLTRSTQIRITARHCSFQTHHASVPCVATLDSHCELHVTVDSLDQPQVCVTNNKGDTVCFYRGSGLWFVPNSMKLRPLAESIISCRALCLSSVVLPAHWHTPSPISRNLSNTPFRFRRSREVFRLWCYRD